MNTDDITIIAHWLSVPANIEKVTTLTFSSEVYNYIVSTHDKIIAGGKNFYKINGCWHLIKKNRKDVHKTQN